MYKIYLTMGVTLPSNRPSLKSLNCTNSNYRVSIELCFVILRRYFPVPKSKPNSSLPVTNLIGISRIIDN